MILRFRVETFFKLATDHRDQIIQMIHFSSCEKIWQACVCTCTNWDLEVTILQLSNMECLFQVQSQQTLGYYPGRLVQA